MSSVSNLYRGVLSIDEVVFISELATENMMIQVNAENNPPEQYLVKINIRGSIEINDKVEVILNKYLRHYVDGRGAITVGNAIWLLKFSVLGRFLDHRGLYPSPLLPDEEGILYELGYKEWDIPQRTDSRMSCITK